MLVLTPFPGGGGGGEGALLCTSSQINLKYNCIFNGRRQKFPSVRAASEARVGHTKCSLSTC